MGCSVLRTARVRAAVYSIAIAGSLQVSVARTEPLPPLAELLRQSQSLAPQLIEGESNLQAAQGLARQAAALPNPVVSYQSENFAGTRDFSRISPVQNTLSLSQTLEVGGKRSARIAAETANAAAVSAGFEQAQLDFARDLAISYATCEVAASQVTLLEEELTRATEDERAARVLVQTGRESDLRSIQARAALTNTQAGLEQARASLSESLIRISTLAGVAEQYTDVRPLLCGRMDATVRSVTAALNDQTRAATVVLTLSSTAGQKLPAPGEFVHVVITPRTSAPTGIVLSSAAVQRVEGRDIVFVRTGDGFRVQPVVVASRSAGRALITSGLKAGEQVAAQNAFFLKAELGKRAEGDEE